MPVPLNPEFLAGYSERHKNQPWLLLSQLRYNPGFLLWRKIAVLHSCHLQSWVLLLPIVSSPCRYSRCPPQKKDCFLSQVSQHLTD